MNKIDYDPAKQTNESFIARRFLRSDLKHLNAQCPDLNKHVSKVKHIEDNLFEIRYKQNDFHINVTHSCMADKAIKMANDDKSFKNLVKLCQYLDTLIDKKTDDKIEYI